MAPRSRVLGGQTVRRQLRRLPNEIIRDVRREVADGGEAILADAQKLAPEPGRNRYATGKLKKGLKLRLSKDGLTARVGTLGKRRPRHAHLVEFGVAPHTITMPDGSVRHHPGQAAQPFLLPAYKLHRDTTVKAIAAAVNRALRRAGRL